MLLARERFSRSVILLSGRRERSRERVLGESEVVTTWHEELLLIDGELVPASNGATYETVAPATEAVLGVAADATVSDAQRAIGAARRAFDATEFQAVLGR